MKIKFIKIEKVCSEVIKFQKTGAISFKVGQCEKLGITEKSAYKIGYDCEAKALTSLYFVPVEKGEEGFLVKKSKQGTTYINGKNIAKQLNIKLPVDLNIGYLPDDSDQPKGSFILFINSK
jgi:hypothetical protein